MKKDILVNGNIIKLSEEEMVIRFSPMAHKMAYKYKNLGFEDMLQECYMAIMKAYREYDIDKAKDSTTFVYRCIENAMMSRVSHYSHKKRNPREKDISIYSSRSHGFSDNPVSILDTIPCDFDVSLYVVRKVYREEVIKYINSSKTIISKDREVIHELMKGKTEEQIATEMKCSRQNVWRRKQRAFKTIRRKFL